MAGPCPPVVRRPGTQISVTPSDQWVFQAGAKHHLLPWPHNCRAKGSLPIYPLRRGRVGAEMLEKFVLSSLLEVPFQNHRLPKLEGLKSSSGPTPNTELGTLKGRDWPKVTEQDRAKMVTGKGNVE